jgi:hypothetical protein
VLARYQPSLGGYGYHNFMIAIGFGFHKIIYNRVQFSLFFYKIYMSSKGDIYIYIYDKLNQFSQCQFSKIWKQLVLLYLFSQTRYYLFIFVILILIFKFIYFILFLNNVKKKAMLQTIFFLNKQFVCCTFTLQQFHHFLTHLQTFLTTLLNLYPFQRFFTKLNGDLHPTLGSLS